MKTSFILPIFLLGVAGYGPVAQPGEVVYAGGSAGSVAGQLSSESDYVSNQCTHFY